MKKSADPSTQMSRAGLSRRQLLAGAAVLAARFAQSPLTATALGAGPQARVRLTLPAPTGPYAIGTVSLHLVDHDRLDPWLSTPRPRELMVSVWYPARHAGHRLAPWMSSAALAHFREYEVMKLGAPLDNVDYPITHGRERAPVHRSAAPCPVVLYSPSGAAARAVGTSQVEDLASHGYVVVTIDHTYNAIAVEFPRGRVELNPAPPTQPGPPPEGTLANHIQVALHRADARFVLDKLGALAAGVNPDAERRPLPAGLRDAMDLDRIGIFGHSFGGCTTAQTMANDDRIRAGINLDGHVVPDVPLNPPGTGTPEETIEPVAQVARAIGPRPFMIMSSGGRGPDELGRLMTSFWYNLTGWRRFLTLIGSNHGSYVDDSAFYKQLRAAGILPSEPSADIDRIDPDRAMAVERAYIRAFFDLCLRDRDTQLLDGPSAEYPEVAFMDF